MVSLILTQVIELGKPHSERCAQTLKDIGNHLNSHSSYGRMLDEEGKRCWTLQYASTDEEPGFHLDILPALPSEHRNNQQIDITDKNNTGHYRWSVSNPRDYYLWFKSRNVFKPEFVELEKQRLYQENSNIFTSAAEVPTQLLRSPLQRAIQIMKRHRDVHFSDRGHRPISIIISTIMAHQGDAGTIFDNLMKFVGYVRARHHEYIAHGYLEQDGILDFDRGCWKVLNPVHLLMDNKEQENFADKWNREPGFPSAFYLGGEAWQRPLCL